MKLIKIEDNKNNIVNKHQELIHSARYSLGETAIKTLSMLISMIKVSDDEFQQYAIKLSEFKELTGASGNEVFKYVDRMTNDLMSNPFWVGDSKMNWVTIAKYRKDENIVVFEVHRELKPYLLGLKERFLTYNIVNILSLKSTYVIRLYELCADKLNEHLRYHPKSKNYEFEIKIDRLRELFQIPKSYLYADIKRAILEKAKKQFKEKTDIQITYKEIKLGRKVTTLQITVKSNDKGSNDYLDNIKAFISHMRINYVNMDILEGKDRKANKVYLLSVDPDGKIYDKYGTSFNKDRSKELWARLYELALEDNLPCLESQLSL